MYIDTYSYSASGKAQKAALLGTSKASTPWKKKTPASNANSPSMKPAKATSLDEKMEAATHNENHEGIEKQISEPSPQKVCVYETSTHLPNLRDMILTGKGTTLCVVCTEIFLFCSEFWF